MRKNCKYCGTEFEARRNHAEYCSNNCRQMAHRQKHGLAPNPFDKSLGSVPVVEVPNEKRKELELSLVNQKRALSEVIKHKSSLITERAKIALTSPDVIGTVGGIAAGASIGALLSNEKGSGQAIGALIGAVLGAGSGYYIGATQYPKNIQKRLQKIALLDAQINELSQLQSNLEFSIEVLRVEIKSTPAMIREEAKKPVTSEREKVTSVTGIPMPVTPVTKEKELVTLLSGVSNASNKRENKSVVSSSEISKMYFESLNFGNSNIMNTLFGQPAENFYALIYGSPGQGKSTLSLKIAEYLANNHGKTLYVVREEGISLSVKEKVNQGKIVSEYLDFGDLKNIEEVSKQIDLRKYRFVILDSITTMGAAPEEVTALKKKHPRIGVVIVAQATKAGDAKGSNEWLHDVDIALKVAQGEVEVVKNRFSAKRETVKLF
jgi:DNA replication protein DnaC